MLYTKAAVVALLPTFGMATRFLSGQQLDSGYGGTGDSDQLSSNLMSTGGLPASNQDFPEGDSPQGNGNAGNADGVNDCGFSDFVQLTEDDGFAQADVEDCEALIQSIVNDQEWIITPTLRTLVANGSCEFQAVVSKGQGNGLIAAVGNADVIDLVTDSIKQFGEDGSIGCHGSFNMYASAAGAMPCDSPNLSSGEQVYVDWILTTPDSGSGGSGDSGDSGHSAKGGAPWVQDGTDDYDVDADSQGGATDYEGNGNGNGNGGGHPRKHKNGGQNSGGNTGYSSPSYNGN